MPDATTTITTDAHAAWAAEHGESKVLFKTVIPTRKHYDVIVSTAAWRVEETATVVVETRAFGGRCDGRAEAEDVPTGQPDEATTGRALDGHIAMLDRVFDAHMRPRNEEDDR